MYFSCNFVDIFSVFSVLVYTSSPVLPFPVFQSFSDSHKQVMLEMLVLYWGKLYYSIVVGNHSSLNLLIRLIIDITRDSFLMSRQILQTFSKANASESEMLSLSFTHTQTHQCVSPSLAELNHPTRRSQE